MLNATSGLMKIGMDLPARQESHDLTTGPQTITTFGHPDWERIFHEIARRGRHHAVDVYFCGPYRLAQVVKHAARRRAEGFPTGAIELTHAARKPIMGTPPDSGSNRSVP